jgi:hypothetical protein
MTKSTKVVSLASLGTYGVSGICNVLLSRVAITSAFDYLAGMASPAELLLARLARGRVGTGMAQRVTAAAVSGLFGAAVLLAARGAPAAGARFQLRC